MRCCSWSHLRRAHTYWTSDSLCKFPVWQDTVRIGVALSVRSETSSISPSARRALCRPRALAGLQLTSGGFCWSVRSCRFKTTGGHVRNGHGARLVDNPRTVSCATPQGKAAKGFAHLHRFAIYVACLAAPFRAPEVWLSLWCARRTRRPSTRDLQQCDNFFLWHVFRVHGLHAVVRKTEASQRLIHRSTSALPHTSLSKFSLSLSPWTVRGPSTIPTFVGASCEGETVGKIGEEDDTSERELVLVISVKCGKDGDMTRG